VVNVFVLLCQQTGGLSTSTTRRPTNEFCNASNTSPATPPAVLHPVVLKALTSMDAPVIVARVNGPPGVEGANPIVPTTLNGPLRVIGIPSLRSSS